jgi:hypothetical protein
MKTLSQEQILYLTGVLLLSIFILRTIQLSQDLLFLNHQGVFDSLFFNK